MTESLYVTYLRVSTQKQGRSGLGLDAQRSAVERYLNGQTPLAEFVEIESGRGKNALVHRPQLREALELCRKKKAVLLIAALDRLARNVHFISGLMESGIEFRAVDLPMATRFTTQIHAVMAEEEGHKIAERVKNALAEAKKRGVRLGNPNPGEAGLKGAKASQEKAVQFAANVLPIIKEIRGAGIDTLAGVATALNVRGIPTARGTRWYPSTVRALLRRKAAPT